MKFFILLLIAVLIAGCTPQISCQDPATLIGNRCCLDSNSNKICDNDEDLPEPEVVSEPEVEVEPELEVEPEVELEPEVVPEPKVEEPIETGPKEGTFKIKLGEPKKFIEILDLETHRYSADKVMLDEIWYVVR
ncbi:hypothetical protein ACFL0V_06115, partial [Nanoarchaeota archaeon]